MIDDKEFEHNIKSLIAPYTINSIPGKSLMAFTDRGEISASLPDNTTTADKIIKQYVDISADYTQLAKHLQKEVQKHSTKHE